VIPKLAGRSPGRDADRQVAQRGQGQRDRIADQERAGGDRRGVDAAEGHLAVGARDDVGAGIAQSDPRGADGERAAAAGVGQAHPQRVAAEAGADVHPQGVVAERGALGRRGRGGPGANPMPIALHRHGM